MEPKPIDADASHVVLGAGEVGTAVAEVLASSSTVVLRDIEPVEVRARVLHVCIPWQSGFVSSVETAADLHGVDLVIVHSTVPVGTCDPRMWVHSPVRGRHPNLTESLRTFTKHFGGVRASDAAKLWASISKTAVHDRAAETEAGKLWELAQFGVQVRITQTIHAWCHERGLDPDVVYRQMAETYNDGYAALGEHRFIRPVLDYIPGRIGGHCVTENSYLLDHPISEIVREGWSDS